MSSVVKFLKSVSLFETYDWDSLYELAAIVGGWRSDGARAAPAQPQI